MIINRLFQSSLSWRVMLMLMPSLYFVVWLSMSFIFVSAKLIMLGASAIAFIHMAVFIGLFLDRYNRIVASDASVVFINNVIFRKMRNSILIWIVIVSLGSSWGLLGFVVSSIGAMWISGVIFMFSCQPDFELISPNSIIAVPPGCNVVRQNDDNGSRVSESSINGGAKSVLPAIAGVASGAYTVGDNIENITITSDSLNDYSNVSYHDDYSYDSINPGSGLPMMNDSIDIQGNAFGDSIRYD